MQETIRHSDGEAAQECCLTTQWSIDTRQAMIALAIERPTLADRWRIPSTTCEARRSGNLPKSGSKGTSARGTRTPSLPSGLACGYIPSGRTKKPR